jgi:hypothetical protein
MINDQNLIERFRHAVGDYGLIVDEAAMEPLSAIVARQLGGRSPIMGRPRATQDVSRLERQAARFIDPLHLRS